MTKYLLAGACALLLAACGHQPLKHKTKHKTKQKYTEPVFIDKTGTYCDFSPKTIVVEINKIGTGEFIACQDHSVLRSGRISSGRPKTHGTPRGDFNVIWKAYEYDSKKYPSKDGGKNMRRALFFTNKGHAMHNGNIRGLSHGCIRTQMHNADWLYEWADNGTRIIVQNTQEQH